MLNKKNSKNKFSKNIMYLLLLCVMGYGAYSLYSKFTALPKYNKLEATIVNTTTASKRFLLKKELLPAKLEADDSVVIMSEVSGRIKTLNVVEGNFVKQGTLLAQLEDAEQAASVSAYQAEYERSIHNLEKAKLLAEKGDIPQQTLKEKELETATSESKKNQAEAILAKMRIFAPFDGVLGLKQVSVGAFVQPNAEITKLHSLNPLRVLFSVSSDKVAYVNTGNKVQVFVDHENLPIEGTILAHEPDLQTSTHMINVVAQIDNSSNTFFPGQHAKVGLITSKEEEVLAVPESALIKGDNEIYSVFVMKQNIAVKTEVELGSRRGEGYVEILTGLKENDEIIIDLGESRNTRLSDGMPVKKLTPEAE